MTIELEDWILHRYNNRPGKRYSGGNQVVAKIIWIKEFDEKVKKYLESISAEWCDRNKVQINGEFYRVLKASDHARGYRSYEAIIDDRIDDEIMRTIVMPTMDLYCRKAEVF